MNARDALFEDIQTLSDEAEELGLVDVSLVLEFAMDVYLKETGVTQPESPLSAGELLEQSGETLKARHKNNPSETTRLGCSMSVFPLSQVYRVAS